MEANRLLLLELFSGTGSVGKAFRRLPCGDDRWDVVSVDTDPKAEGVTVQKDVLQFDPVKDLPRKSVDCIWASPPCTQYSIARTTGPPRDLEGADALVRKTLEIAAALGNPPLFIENPYTGLLKTRGILDHLNLRAVDYCSYGMPYRKRTAIWTNTDWIPARALCKHKKHLARAQQGPPGPRVSMRELYRMPAELCDEIARYCDELLS